MNIYLEKLNVSYTEWPLWLLALALQSVIWTLRAYPMSACLVACKLLLSFFLRFFLDPKTYTPEAKMVPDA